MSSTICFVAGHSGGHIIPCLTMASEIKAQAPTTRVVFISCDSALDRKIVGTSQEIDSAVYLQALQVPYRKPWLLPLFVFTFIKTFLKSWWLLRKEQPTKLITTGGYLALPVCLAAQLLRIPVELFELNVTPGKTIKTLAPFAQTIHVVFAQTSRYFAAHKVKLKPYPIRFHTLESEDHRQLLQQFQFSHHRFTLFVLGGSQGSRALNNFVREWIDQRPSLHYRIQIIHQVGDGSSVSEQKQWYSDRNIPSFVFAYSNYLAPLYQVADVVVTRAGSGTLAELQFFKKKALIIPLETLATDHQLHNAQAVAALNPELFKVLRQKDIEKDTGFLFEQLSQIVTAKPYKSPDCSC
jgi:UDP-N-acetylglucosamine--N-acetylmuramyl-(pentapeptide) pyrophosphoryl-undecaprenol N-acetylglucosamine transferase